MSLGASRGATPREAPFFMTLVAVACGVAGALGATLFRLLIRLAQGLFFGGPEGVAEVLAGGLLAEPQDPLAAAQVLPWWLCIAIPAAGGLLVGPFVHFLAREVRGHGVPEVMHAVAVRGGVIRPRIAVVTTVASALCIGSGGSVGREGPIVQIGAAIGSAIGQWLRVPARQLRTLVGCGAAAGMAATFNAPIAGALFAVEVILGDFAVAQFSPIVISAVVATVLSRFLLGNHPSFPVPEYELVSPFELGSYMGVGVVAGLLGVALIWSVSGSERLWERVALPEWLKPALGGVLVGVIAIGVPNVYGVGYGTVTQVLAGSLAPAALALFLVAKLVATALYVGSGGSGGLFTPAIFLGATAGGLCGSLLDLVFPEATASSGAYALVTMGAVVAATTHAPISSILIIFEMTQSIAILPPLMAACVLSTLVARFLQKESMFTLPLARRGVDLRPDEDPNVLKSLWVRDVVDPRPQTVPASASLERVLDLIVESDHTEFFVVDESGAYVGPVRLAEVRRLLHEREHLAEVVVARDLVAEGRPGVTPEDNLDLAMSLFAREPVEELAVVDAENPTRLVGSLHRRDVIHALQQETLRRDLPGGLSSAVAAAERVRAVDLGGGYEVRDFHAPHRFVGRTLRELEIRERSGVQVLLVRRSAAQPGEALLRVPGPEDRIEAGDVLVVAGTAASLDALERI